MIQCTIDAFFWGEHQDLSTRESDFYHGGLYFQMLTIPDVNLKIMHQLFNI